MGERRSYKAPDGSVELILREDPSDPDDQVNGERHGKHYVLRYLKTGIQADFGTLPGFFGAAGRITICGGQAGCHDRGSWPDGNGVGGI